MRAFVMLATKPKWYAVWAKAKHEHIAAANLDRNLNLETFLPRLQFKKITRRGPREVTEPLFPGYLFVRCVLEDWMSDIQHTGGVNRLVQFGGRIPSIADSVIEELQRHFESGKVVLADDPLRPGDEVTVAHGAFAGMNASVLRNSPPRRRIQILLEILGRPATVEVERYMISPRRNTIALLVPFLAVVPSAAKVSACSARA